MFHSITKYVLSDIYDTLKLKRVSDILRVGWTYIGLGV